MHRVSVPGWRVEDNSVRFCWMHSFGFSGGTAAAVVVRGVVVVLFNSVGSGGG